MNPTPRATTLSSSSLPLLILLSSLDHNCLPRQPYYNRSGVYPTVSVVHEQNLIIVHANISATAPSDAALNTLLSSTTSVVGNMFSQKRKCFSSHSCMIGCLLRIPDAICRNMSRAILPVCCHSLCTTLRTRHHPLSKRLFYGCQPLFKRDPILVSYSPHHPLNMVYEDIILTRTKFPNIPDASWRAFVEVGGNISLLLYFPPKV
jgi:hypothetical protein